MEDTYKHKGLRRLLVRELRQKGIRDEAVLAAIGAVPRHFFVEKAFDDLVYTDIALPIDCEQTISQPYTVAYQTLLLNVQPQDKILEIGTGSGYQACILVEMQARVFTIERQQALYEQVGALLDTYFQAYKYRLRVFFRDGAKGLAEYAPFNKIIVTAAASTIPQVLCEQLEIGGILIIPVGDPEGEQVMCRITRLSDTEFKKERFDLFRFVPLLEGIQPLPAPPNHWKK
ncbi:MAG: hypothetical protein RI894_2445 [Bacteroidota bacterium]